MGEIFAYLLVTGVLMAGSAYVGFWIGTGGGERSRAAAVKKDFDDYRERVTSHFARTAEHFQTIGKEYRALYEHMAAGADSLCDPNMAKGQLSFDPQPGAAAADSARQDDPDEPAAAQGRAVAGSESIEPQAEEPNDSGRRAEDRASASGGEDETVAAAGDDAAAVSGGSPDAPAEEPESANEPQSAAAEGEDEATPDKLARDAGGESAPPEPEAAATESNGDGRAASEKSAEAPGDDDGAIRVEEAVKNEKEGERTYH